MVDEKLMNNVIENMEHMVRVMNDQDHIIYMNRKMREEFGDKVGSKCYESLEESTKCENCICEGCQRSGHAESRDFTLKDRYFRVIASPVKMDGNAKYSIELFHDITSEKQLEQELNNQYKRMKNDVSFAKQIQNRVLPVDGEYWNTLRLDSAYLPSEELGGDLYDLFQIDEDHVLFYIADVSGHGIQSSLLTIFLRQVIRGLKAEAVDPRKILEEMIRNYQDLHLDSEQYFSILFCVYHKDTKELILVNAGHNALPLLLRKDGTMEEVSISGMPVCSLLTEATQESKTVRMETGDRIVLYTDGISEAWNEETKSYFNSDALIKWIETIKVNSSQELISKLVQHVIEFSGGRVADDIAAFVVEIL